MPLTGWWPELAGLFGPARMARWMRAAGQIIAQSEALVGASAEDLAVRQRELSWRARSGEPLARLLVEAFALVREAARREFGYCHFPVQIVGGIAMFEGHIAEMQTGEGKTLTVTQPAFLRALRGQGCHVITVNDYLVERDSGIMGRVYKRLGMTTGFISGELKDGARRKAYACDITYTTAKEAGFDFLRDRLKREASNPHLGGRWNDRWPARPAAASRGGGIQLTPDSDDAPVHRGFYCALIDEADSVLLDEARTPLIIGLALPTKPAAMGLLRWARGAAETLHPAAEFTFDPGQRRITLTEAGCRKVVLQPKPSLIDGVETERLYESVEQALLAQHAFHRDRDYVVEDEKVSIVDESTGRIMEGRKWQEGLHQAIEVKERLPVTAATGEAARVTVQSFFREYLHVAGMTGTALSAAAELKRAYRLNVSRIPTHRPCLREEIPSRVFATQEAKRRFLSVEIGRLRDAGRAVLIGTPSVSASESLGAVLEGFGIPHLILNARQQAEEAAIVAQAGQPGRVTIATNMAGRGTDIHLHDSVRKSGGLHVFATEMHSSARIDRQLVGRAARQGDPGSYQIVVSLEDELLRVLPPEKLHRIRQAARPDARGELPASALRLFREIQDRIERRDARHRKDLLAAERQRRAAHRRMGLDPCLELPE